MLLCQLKVDMARADLAEAFSHYTHGQFGFITFAAQVRHG